MALDLFKPRGAIIEWSVLDAAQGVAAGAALLQGQRTVWQKHFAGHAIIELALRAELTRMQAEGVPPIVDVRQWEAVTRETPVLGASDNDLDRVPDEVALAYRAMRRSLTSLYATRRPVPQDTPSLDVPIDVPGALPIVIALTVVGVAAVVGTAWFATEQAEQKVELEKHRITVLGQIDLYLRDLNARIAAGAPLPDPPDTVIQAANADNMQGPMLIGAGLLLGAAAVGGAVYALRKPRAATFGTATNPARRRARARRANPSTPAGEAAPAKPRKKNPSRKRRKKVIRPHKRKSSKCKHCGRAHTSSQHWSHAKAAKKGPRGGAYKRKRKATRKRRRRNPVANPRKRKKVVRPHGRKSAKCKHCGKAHSSSQHWSHAKAAKRGPRGGAYKRKRVAKKRSAAAKRGAATRKRKKAASRKKRPVRKSAAKPQRRKRNASRRKL